jgi:hypothetical protein
MYEYQVIRYFENELSEEFINVGIMLNGTENRERIISEIEAQHLYCSVLIGKNKKFYAMVEYLNKLQQENKLRDPYQYFHNFRFSEPKHLASSKSEEIIFDELFESYIAYKFQTEEKMDRRIQLIQDSYKIAKNDFKNFIQIDKSKQFDFEMKNLKNSNIYHSNVGSIANKQDVFKMTMETPLHKNNVDKYHFLDMAITLKENDSKERLGLNKISVYSYASDEEIYKYMEKIAV